MVGTRHINLIDSHFQDIVPRAEWRDLRSKIAVSSDDIVITQSHWPEGVCFSKRGFQFISGYTGSTTLLVGPKFTEPSSSRSFWAFSWESLDAYRAYLLRNSQKHPMVTSLYFCSWDDFVDLIAGGKFIRLLTWPDGVYMTKTGDQTFYPVGSRYDYQSCRSITVTMCGTTSTSISLANVWSIWSDFNQNNLVEVIDDLDAYHALTSREIKLYVSIK